MTIENSEIALLIQQARKEKNMGQKQLAQEIAENQCCYIGYGAR